MIKIDKIEMRIKLLIVFLFTFFGVNSQEFKVVEKETNTKIVDANIFIDGKFFSITNSDGCFLVDMTKDFNAITITHLSYVSLTFSKQEFLLTKKLELVANSIKLEDIFVSKNKRVNKSSLLFPEISRWTNRRGITAPYGSQHGVFVPNDVGKECYIKKILIETSEDANNPPYEESIPFLPFKVSLFTVNLLTGFPERNLFLKSAIIRKIKGNKYAELVIDDNTILFPKEGVFIVVEILSEEETFARNSNLNRPAFHALIRKKKSKFKELYKHYENGSWSEHYSSKLALQCFNFGLETQCQ